MTEDEIRETFRYHHLDDDSQQALEMIRTVMTSAVQTVAKHLPQSRERSLFITLCQQAQMMANASIAIHGRETKK